MRRRGKRTGHRLWLLPCTHNFSGTLNFWSSVRQDLHFSTKIVKRHIFPGLQASNSEEAHHSFTWLNLWSWRVSLFVRVWVNHYIFAVFQLYAKCGTTKSLTFSSHRSSHSEHKDQNHHPAAVQYENSLVLVPIDARLQPKRISLMSFSLAYPPNVASCTPADFTIV